MEYDNFKVESKKLSIENIKDLKDEFTQYLITKKSKTDKSAKTYVTDSFYPLKNYIGMNFWDIFKDEYSLQNCHELLEKHFDNEGIKRGKPYPKNHAKNDYMLEIRWLKEFFDNEYGGVDKYIGQKLNW